MKRILFAISISFIAILAVSHLLAGDVRSSKNPSVVNSKAHLNNQPNQAPVPSTFTLRSAHSHLFESGTPLDYTVARRGMVQLRVFDILGEEVLTLEQKWRTPGFYTTTWDGRDARGNRVENGIYFVRLSAPGVSKTIRVVSLNNRS